MSSEWISVNDRLPEAGYGQILCTASGRVIYGWLRSWPGPKAKKWKGVHYVIGEEVTHWQPLPAPPKEQP